MAKKFKCNVCGKTFEASSMPEKCPICGAPASEVKEVKTGLNTNSNVYTIVYAAVMVIIVAFLLAFVSSALKPAQDANEENDTKGQILTAMGFDKSSIDVKAEFDKVEDFVLDTETQTILTPYEGKFESSYGKAIKKGRLHVFVGKNAEGKEVYVLPVIGRGLWGGLWGYIALSFDCNVPTVMGTYFYHESETAGLGARIGDRDFQEQFIGKPIYAGDNTDEIALTVVKSGAAEKETEVNGVTGATLTSKGVSDMVKDGLKVYENFIKSKTPALLGGMAVEAEGCAMQHCGECPNEAGCEAGCEACPNKADCEGECPKAGCEKQAGCPKGHCKKMSNN